MRVINLMWQLFDHRNTIDQSCCETSMTPSTIAQLTTPISTIRSLDVLQIHMAMVTKSWFLAIHKFDIYTVWCIQNNEVARIATVANFNMSHAEISLSYLYSQSCYSRNLWIINTAQWNNTSKDYFHASLLHFIPTVWFMIGLVRHYNSIDHASCKACRASSALLTATPINARTVAYAVYCIFEAMES